jgi:GR25 family glycosyltransferase involved in LPS biosynthesis
MLLNQHILFNKLQKYKCNSLKSNELIDLPIYYINLDTSINRYNNFNQQIKTYDIPYNLINKVSAIDGKNYDASSLPNKIKNVDPLFLACLLSHIKAIQTAYNDLCEYAIIMEDDCNFEYVQYQNYKLSDIAYIYGTYYNVIQLTTTNKHRTNNKLKMNPAFLLPGYRDSAVAYIINRKGMKNVLDSVFNVNTELKVSDITIFECAKKCCYLTKPYFIYFDSAIINTTLTLRESMNKYEDENKLFWDKYYNSTSLIREKIRNINSINTTVYIFKEAKEYSINIINRILDVLSFTNIRYTDNINEADIIFIHYFERKEINAQGLRILINGESLNDAKFNFDIYIDSINPVNCFHIYYPEIFQSSMYNFGKQFPIIEKTKFCAYMYSYDSPHRVHYFKLLSKYKFVEALGKSMNNITRKNDRFQQNFKDIAIELYSKYKFVLALENVIRDGYSTEKLLLPLFSNSIPIYYGSSKIFEYINKKRVIYIDDYKSDEELTAFIKMVDNDDVLYNSIVQEKWFVNDHTFETITTILLDNPIKNVLKA